MFVQIQPEPIGLASPAHYRVVGRVRCIQANQQVSTLVRWAFYAFVFSLLFEAAPIGIEVETTQITGGLLITALVFLQPRMFLQRLPAAVGYLLIYFLVGCLVLLANNDLFDGDIPSRQFLFLQLIALFLISCNLMKEERTARGTLITLIASCSTLSILEMFGLTTTIEIDEGKLSRFTAFGLDSNQLAGVLAIGWLAAVGFAYENSGSRVRRLLLILPVLVLVSITMVRTGSRGGLLALSAGLIVFSLGKGAFSARLRNLCTVVILFALFGLIAYQSELIRRRFQVTLDEGTMSKREHFYPMAAQMILEKPLIGWGPVANSIELAQRVQLYRFERMDPHNLVLYVLTATGIVGAIPFFASIWLCLRSTWRARDGTFGNLPLAMIVTLLVSEMSVTGFHWKHHWIVLAYCLTSSPYLASSSLRVVRQTLQAAPRMDTPGFHQQSPNSALSAH